MIDIKKKPWKTKVERDVIMHDDLRESGLQGGKTVGNHLGLLSLIIGLPLFIVGIFACVNMLFDLGIVINGATIILVIVVTIIGFLMTIGGYYLF